MSVTVPPTVAPMIPRTLFNADHEAFRATARRFFETEIAPHHEKWEEQQHIDRHLWNKAGELGLLCCTMPEEFGGVGCGSSVFDDFNGRAGSCGRLCLGLFPALGYRRQLH